MSRDAFDRFQPRERGLFGDNEQAEAPGRGPRPRVTNASDLVDITLVLHHQTDRAVLVSITGEEARAVWLPKSRIEVERTGGGIVGTRKDGAQMSLETVVVTVPEGLAKDKGLL